MTTITEKRTRPDLVGNKFNKKDETADSHLNIRIPANLKGLFTHVANSKKNRSLTAWILETCEKEAKKYVAENENN